MKRRWMVLLGLGLLVVGDVIWPYVFVEPSLLAEARKDVSLLDGAIGLREEAAQAAGMRVSLLPVGRVFVLADGTRLRVVSNSHHNPYIGYDGVTYVNVGNRVFSRRGGHCAAYWHASWPGAPDGTKDTVVAELLKTGYIELTDRR